MRIVTVLGARPQFIKASAVSAQFAEQPGVDEIIVHTGQHFDPNMSSVIFTELGIPRPKYHLNIHGGTHGQMTGRMLEGVEQVLLNEKPDVVLVYGDTNSTLAGALAASKLHIPVAHVEAGLRSFNLRMPEEVNRILTDRISAWLFAPTDDAVKHLQQEGVEPTRIHQIGDVMYDVALYHGARASIREDNMLRRLGLQPKNFVLATVHRAENTDDPAQLDAIVEGFKQVARRMPVVWPMHPRTRDALSSIGMLSSLRNELRVTEPLGYLDMVELERAAAVIATDSGGVQKEAFFHGTPCVTLRSETEWVELIEAKWNRLAPPESADIVFETIVGTLGTKGRPIQPYGDGTAARRIVQELQRCFESSPNATGGN